MKYSFFIKGNSPKKPKSTETKEQCFQFFKKLIILTQLKKVIEVKNAPIPKIKTGIFSNGIHNICF